MYLHLGNDCAVDADTIIGVFDIDNTTVSKRGRRFLPDAEKSGQTVNVSDDLPRSFIVTDDSGYVTVYISSISPQTLLKRLKSGKNQINNI